MAKISLKMVKGNNALILNADGSIHIGRSGEIRWFNLPARIKPVGFDTLEKAIVIDAGYVSRNHCALVPNNDGTFSIVDMCSRNGTYLGHSDLSAKTQLPPNVPTKLNAGDVFTVGPTDFHVEYPATPIRNFGLLIGHEGGNLRGVTQDLTLLSNELKHRGFRDDLRLWINEHATKDGVLGLLKQLAPETARESHLFFHYSGHGSPKGLCLEGKTLSPKEFYEHLRPIQGKKALFFDCCHAGVFLEPCYVDSLSNSLIVTATDKTSSAYEASASIAQGKSMGVLTREIVKYLRAHPSLIDLVDMGTVLERDLPVGKYRCKYQHPLVGGDVSIFNINPTDLSVGSISHSQESEDGKRCAIEDKTSPTPPEGISRCRRY